MKILAAKTSKVVAISLMFLLINSVCLRVSENNDKEMANNKKERKFHFKSKE